MKNQNKTKTRNLGKIFCLNCKTETEWVAVIKITNRLTTTLPKCKKCKNALQADEKLAEKIRNDQKANTNLNEGPKEAESA